VFSTELNTLIISNPKSLEQLDNMTSFLLLGARAQDELWPPQQPASILLYSSSIHPSEADCLVSEQFSFYGVRMLASRPTPNLEDQGIPLRLAPTP
jgi:hypothetical protein